MSANDAVKTQVLTLQKEVTLLRSFIIGFTGKDREGHYRAAFVRRLFRQLAERPKYLFKDATSFLNQLHRA